VSQATPAVMVSLISRYQQPNQNQDKRGSIYFARKINLDGFLDSADISFVKSKSGFRSFFISDRSKVFAKSWAARSRVSK